MPAKTVALHQSSLYRLPGESKDIYGSGWRAFQGITDSGSGVDEIQDTQSDYLRARGVESYIFRAQDVRGSAIDSVPLRVWSTDERGRRSAVPHPALDLLEQNVPADPAYTPGVSGSAALMRYTLLALDGHGRCAWQLANDGRQPTEIYWLPPTSWRPLHGYEASPKTNAPFGGIEFRTIGGSRNLAPDKIVYFQTDNPGDYILGTSKVSILRNAINLRGYSQKSNMDFFKHSMRPDWILTGEWKNSEENTERIKRGLRRHYTGESNREPMVLGEGAKAQLLTTSQKDAEWSNMMRIVQEEISAVYGVPVVYLNNMERATYQNIETAKLMLWHDTMMPETKKLAAMLTQRFLYRFWPDARQKRYEFGFDYNTVTGLSEDVARIWERFNALTDRVAKEVETRQITPNQARQILARLAEQLGLDPTPWQTDLPDGDVFYLPETMLPTNQLGVQARIDMQAARSSNPNAIDLIENVPGAPTAGDNAATGIARIQADTQEQLNTQRDIALARSGGTQQNDLHAEIVELKSLMHQWPTGQIVIKTPSPIPIRDSRLAPIQKRLIAKLKALFQAQQQQALRNLRNPKKAQPPPDADQLYDHEKARAEIAALIRAAAAEAGEAAFQASAEDYQLDVAWDQTNPWLDQYFGKRIDLINGIDDTTAETLRQSLLEGATAGETMLQLADRVTAAFNQAVDYRAELIARTETIQAYGFASLAAYAAAGIEKARMYDGANADSADCINVDGQIVTIAEAQALMGMEHPNGTRGVAPYVEIGAQAAAFEFNADGVAVA